MKPLIDFNSLNDYQQNKLKVVYKKICEMLPNGTNFTPNKKYIDINSFRALFKGIFGEEITKD